MEFTPKKQIIPKYNSRHSPYSNDSQPFSKRWKERVNQSGSPQSSHLARRSPQTYSQKRFFTHARKINYFSTKIAHTDEDGATQEKKIKSSPSPQSTKRPFSAVNSVECVKEPTFPSYPSDRDADVFDSKKKHNDENDPYNFCSNHDESLDKLKQDIGKNSILSTPKITAVKSYSSKKKQIDLSRSRLLADVSPEKVEKAYGSNLKSEAEKENVPAETTTTGELVPLPEPTTTLPHLIGFPNYGNTCYLNSVVQALFGLPPFLGDLQLVSSQLKLPSTSLSSGLNQVIAARSKGQVPLVKQSLKTVKENLVRVDGSFSGYKMQDANEFLTRILDTIKDEIDRCHMTTPSPDRIFTSKDDDELLFPNSTNSKKLRKTMGDDFESEMGIHSNGESSTVNMKNKDVQIIEKAFAEEESSLCEKVSSEAESLHMCPVQPTTPNTSFDEEILPRNPVKDNFEFQLFESYRCLGCNEVEGRKQEYFGLYVNLPEKSDEDIQDALSSSMGEDVRELKCGKCGHNRSSVVTSFTKLPRILVVQLKRYEYKAEQGESIKRSSKVPVTRWLALDEYVNEISGQSLWSPHYGNITPRATKQTTLTVRNLSSELNVCEGNKEQEESPVGSVSLSKPTENVVMLPTPDKEDEELREVMWRSMVDFGGTREEDEIQQAIKLSLQDLGMSFENQNHAIEDQAEEESHKLQTEDQDAEEINSHKHAFRLISVISHFGCTTNTGHYVADVYNCEEKSWFHYDDETVSKIPESVVLAEGRQKNGYIFFYVHKDIFQEIEKQATLQR